MSTSKKKTAAGEATRREHHTYVVSTPGMEAAVEKLIAILSTAVAHETSRARDPEQTKLEMARIDLERDRTKLQWEEHKLRVEEFHAQADERADRRREQEERREAERQERYDEAVLRGELYSVRLTDKGSSAIYTIKAVREATSLGLKEAKEMVDMAPTLVVERKLLSDANRVLAKLRAAGAVAELVKVERTE